MSSKNSVLTGIALSLAIAPAPAVANDFLPGLIVGGIIAAGIANGNRGNGGRRSGIASTQEGKDIQSALNYFGFPAGVVDGQLGRKSHAAIANYQAYMGFQSNGDMTDFEKNFLLTSHQRAQLGGPVISQVLSESYEGNRALLLHFRDELNGTATAGVAAAPEVIVVPSGVPSVTPSAAPSVTAPAATLPSFFGNGGAALSLASHCNNTGLATSTNGGLVTQATMVDAEFTLSEQFCMARSHAIVQGQDLLATVQGVTPEQVIAQCDGFVPVMQPHVAALSLKSAEAVTQDVSNFILSSGMSPADLSGSARICLSVGYSTDNMDVAVGSALLLTVLGEKPYGELLGHHLGLGFGVDKRADLSVVWYDMALVALSNGAAPVFGSGIAGRAELIQSAAYALGTTTSTAPASGSMNAKESALPVFSVSQ